MIDHNNLEEFSDPVDYDRKDTSDTHFALRYTFPQELAALLHYNGFRIIRQYGDRNLEPLRTAGRPIIVVCRKRV